MLNYVFSDYYSSTAKTLFLFFVTILISHFVHRWLTKKPKNFPPGPIGVPFLGYWPFLKGETHKKFKKLSKKYGNIISLYMGDKLTVVLNEYEGVNKILNNSVSLDRETTVLKRIDPLGFSSLSGPEWVEQRRFAFYSSRDLGFGKGPWETIIIEEAIHFVKSLEKLSAAPADISQAVHESVTSNILYFLTGKKLNKVADAETLSMTLHYGDIAMKKLGPGRATSVMPWLWYVFVWFRISGYDTFTKTIEDFKAFLRQEVNRHKTEPELKDKQDMINSYLQKMEKLSSVGEPKHSFSEYNLMGMINSLFLGGSDTIVSSLNWVLRLMADHQVIQSKVYSEIMEVLGKEGLARYEDRNSFPYTFAVLMEGARMSSTVPLGNTRKASHDFVIDGYDIPQGTHIITNLWALHNDPKYWPEPEKFQPERFLTTDGKTLLRGLPSYAPFSLGRRNCPGETIAWMELLAYFTEILKKFHITMAPGVKADYAIQTGLVIHLQPQLMCFTERKD